MKIAVYGATGQAGTEVVAEAARRGHDVLALSRHEPAAALPAGATWQQSDVADAAAVETALVGVDAVVLAVGPSREPDADHSTFVGTVVDVARAAAARPTIVIGGAGSLLAAPGVRLVDTPDFPDAYKREALTHAGSLVALQDVGGAANWSYLSPAPMLVPGERTGSYRTGGDNPVGDSISFADLAIAVVDELETPAHAGERWTVATG